MAATRATLRSLPSLQRVGRRPESSVEASRSEGGHVEHVADRSTAAPDTTPPAHGATIAVKRRDADEGSDLFVGEGAEFGQEGEKRRGGNWPDAWYGLEQVGLGLPSGAVLDGLIEVVVGDVDTLLEPGNVLDEFASDLGVLDDGKTALLGRDHVDHLAATYDQVLQGASLCVGQRPARRLNLLGEQGQRLGIDLVGFGKQAQGLGEVTGIAWVDAATGSPAAPSIARGRRSKPPVASIRTILECRVGESSQ